MGSSDLSSAAIATQVPSTMKLSRSSFSGISEGGDEPSEHRGISRSSWKSNLYLLNRSHDPYSQIHWSQMHSLGDAKK